MDTREVTNNRWYRCVDRALLLPDRESVKLELAVDITDLKETQEMQEEWISLLKQAIKLAINAI